MICVHLSAAKALDLTIPQSGRFEVAGCLFTARAFALILSRFLLASADEVIQ